MWQVVVAVVQSWVLLGLSGFSLQRGQLRAGKHLELVQWSERTSGLSGGTAQVTRRHEVVGRVALIKVVNLGLALL